MKSTVIRKGLTASVILGLGALLSACGGGGSGSSAASGSTITGYTVDGPFSASITVYGFEGTSSVSCGSGTSNSSNRGYFSIPLNPNCSGPYLVVATASISSGSDAGTYYYLTSQTSPSNAIYVTPVSTAIVEENAPIQGSATTVLTYFKSPSLLTSIEGQENTYSNGPTSFTYTSATTGNSIVEYFYPIVNNPSSTIPILVKVFTSNTAFVGTMLGSFYSHTLSLYSNTSSTYTVSRTSLPSLSNLSSLTSGSIISSIMSNASPFPTITTTPLSFTHVFFPYTYEVSLGPYSSTYQEIIELTYPINYASNIVPVVATDFYNVGPYTGIFAGSPIPGFSSLSGFFSTNNDSLSLIGYGIISATRYEESQTIFFSGDLNNPSSLSILTYSDSLYPQDYPQNYFQNNPYQIISISNNGIGEIVWYYYNNSNTFSSSGTITTSTPIATATLCSINYSSTNNYYPYSSVTIECK